MVKALLVIQTLVPVLAVLEVVGARLVVAAGF